MSNFFVDTSALAKRYISELGSNWVRSWIYPRTGNQIFISRLTTLEMVSLLMRRQRQTSIALVQVQRVRNNFSVHLRTQYTVIEINRGVLARAKRLLVRHSLRTLDSIQLASALEVAHHLSLSFISADADLLKAAAAEGLPTDDPNAHP